ncbi:EAL and HDOD domain-containing protein [Nitrosovibrio sp. Nv6]|uniref:EAL and HDOD domain-containing protein n=1 Tax=Nitrosovibrio sp. Nv6 TaxID=1855340 RepID=UPI0008ABDDF8|nr:EAL domain-containing protein [Nitrosovibrio sp. Nv6]SEO50248.1 EAL and modified HD-GYP domain-containing signal transduction protein [Nitrosovibrio sp. Nv6]
MILDTAQPVSFAPQVKEFFLARQPILDRNQNLVAYELLFRRADAGPAITVDDSRAATAIIAHTSELGLENVIGGALGFFNVSSAMLMDDLVDFLPCKKVVFELHQTDKISPELVQRVSGMVHEGYRFALDDVITLSEYIKPLLPLIEIVKIDISVMTRADLAILAAQFKQAHKLLLAEKVETIEQFQNCLDLGFDYYQGYYFAKPAILSGKKLTASQLGIMQLMTLVARDADNAEIEHSIKKEVSLCLSLLRLVNTTGMGVTKSIDSLSEALVVLGRNQLQRWLQIQLYIAPHVNTHCASPLLLLATTRGKLLELIARKLKPANKSIADTAFTVGILSLLDTLFGQTMEKILGQIVLGKDVSEALLYRRGFYGDLLKLSEYVEKSGEASRALAPLLLKLELPVEDLYPLQLEAFEWSNSLLPFVHEG